MKENVLGKDELFELETAIPKVYKADADMFTLVPQLPSKYLLLFLSIYLILIVHIYAYILYTNKILFRASTSNICTNMFGIWINNFSKCLFYIF